MDNRSNLPQTLHDFTPRSTRFHTDSALYTISHQIIHDSPPSPCTSEGYEGYCTYAAEGDRRRMDGAVLCYGC